jgi:predicted AlkP superfamily phosphohydrolase/phosphomutase
MTARVLVVAFDAAEATLVSRLCDEGRMPTLAGIRARGLSAPMEPACMDRLPGAIWQDIGTGMSAGRHGDYFPDRIHTGEAMMRDVDPTQHAADYFWARAAAAGHKVAVIDHPLVPVIEVPGVTLVSEWHVHDQLWGTGSHPASLWEELEAAHPRDALGRCDWSHGDSFAGFETWIDHLLSELRITTDMALDLLGRDAWDLFTISFSDGHCAGHQTWHLHDPTAPCHPADVPPRLAGALSEVYEALDVALGRLVDAADADSTIVFASHGMGQYVGGPQLLPVALTRLGYGDPRRLPAWLRPVVPIRLLQRVHRRVGAVRRAAEGVGMGERGFLRPGIRAMAVGNNRVGAVRLNLAEREPAGEVAVADRDRVLAELAAALGELRQVGSGEPIVESVLRTDEVYGPDHHPDLPDLLVVFRQDLGELIDVESPRAGRITEHFRRPDYPRQGDHTNRAHLWAAARGVNDGRLGEAVDVIDIAPTVLSILGVDATGMDGHPIHGVPQPVS